MTRAYRPSDVRPCQCGCGQLSRGQFKNGHRPVNRYRKVGEERKHRITAEAALGHPLPAGAEVHHVDGSKSETSALVICQDRAYHALLHQRTRAFLACGHADWLKCSLCGQYDAPKNLKFNQRRERQTGQRAYHPKCAVK